MPVKPNVKFRAISLMEPAVHTRGLVIDEDATVLDAWFTVPSGDGKGKDV